MRFRVEVVYVGEGGDEARGEVLTMERHHLTMDTLGLTLRESKALLAVVQDFVVAHQAAEDLTQRRPCPSCGKRHTAKGAGAAAVKTLFGVVPVANPRWHRCPCQGPGPKTFRPAASWLVG